MATTLAEAAAFGELSWTGDFTPLDLRRQDQGHVGT